MLTPKMSGLFDCREYDGKNTEHNQRKMKSDDDNIVFSSLFPKEELPDQFKIAGKPDTMLRERATRKERTAAEQEGRNAVPDAYVVKFKIGANAKWFDKYGRQTDRPKNEELEGATWNVQLDFTRKEKDPSNPMKASGYWVNAIMIAKIENNPFAGQAFETAPENEPEQAAPEQEEENGGLLF